MAANLPTYGLNGTAVVDSVSPGGAPFTATGLLAIGNSGSDHVSCGVAYTATNQISTA